LVGQGIDQGIKPSFTQIRDGPWSRPIRDQGSYLPHQLLGPLADPGPDLSICVGEPFAEQEKIGDRDVEGAVTAGAASGATWDDARVPLSRVREQGIEPLQLVVVGGRHGVHGL
jgi:hypothetical protein